MMKSREVFNVDEVSKTLGISRASAYKAIHSGEIPSIRIGGRLLVPRAALKGLLRASTKALARPELGDGEQ